jgi:hypothetical protein
VIWLVGWLVIAFVFVVLLADDNWPEAIAKPATASAATPTPRAMRMGVEMAMLLLLKGLLMIQPYPPLPDALPFPIVSKASA